MNNGVVPLTAVGLEERHQIVTAGQLYRDVASLDHGENGVEVGPGLAGPRRVVADRRTSDQKVQFGGSDLAWFDGETLVDPVESGRTAADHRFAEGQVQPGQPLGRRVDCGLGKGPLGRTDGVGSPAVYDVQFGQLRPGSGHALGVAAGRVAFDGPQQPLLSAGGLAQIPVDEAEDEVPGRTVTAVLDLYARGSPPVADWPASKNASAASRSR